MSPWFAGFGMAVAGAVLLKVSGRGFLGRHGIMLIIAGYVMMLAGNIASRSWGSATVVGASLVAILWMLGRWWWRRRKRALRDLGGRAWARLAAMLATLRARRQPVLRPVPGGAR
jgi:hypothetical protein